MSKIGICMAGALLVLLFAAGAAYATVPQACSDGTAYGACSGVNSPSGPGYICWLDDSSPTGTSLISVYSDSATTAMRNQCSCSKYASQGYVLVNNACVKTTCTDTNGGTIGNGACGATKPKACVNGQLVDNSAQCGCPDGKKPASDGKTCIARVGCRWGTISCIPGKEDCKYDSTNANDDGVCTTKPGCAITPSLCDSTQTCDTSVNATGICKTKAGCTYDNPKCNSTQVCISNACTTKTSDVPIINASGTPANSNATVGGIDFTKICPCCPAPAAGAAAMVGLVSYKNWRNRKKDE